MAIMDFANLQTINLLDSRLLKEPLRFPVFCKLRFVLFTINIIISRIFRTVIL